ncbi:MAG: polyprenyl synthetase family protein [Chloroflexi bacterium]|nr:MAG: polyprenyl synthetase family protein [Chloroflexota bacterium]
MKDFSSRLEGALRVFLAERRPAAVAIDVRLGRLVDELDSAVCAGGKRLRPELLAWGYRAGGRELDDAVVRAAASLELLHTFALIQDDVMDESLTRRGRPASHVNLAAEAEIAPERFGASAAILLGDLSLIWADQLLLGSGVPPERLTRGLSIYNEMRTEVTLGQYLDVLAAHSRRVTEEQALTVNHYKTASYTVQRPIQLGLALAGAPDELVRCVSGYAIPAGIAFQLRDDVLGAFGDPAVTGKPSGEDLRERKPTWLWARTLRLCPEAERTTDVARLRELVVESGALAEAEAKIEALFGEARAAAEALPVDAGLVCELLAVTERLAWRRS